MRQDKSSNTWRRGYRELVNELAGLKGLGDWPKVRKEIESAVLSVVGKPTRNAIDDQQVKIMDEMDFAGFSRKRINYFVDDWTRVTAWLFTPEGKDVRPAILCCHQQTHRGKDEPAGMDGSPLLAFAQHYAEKGYVTLAPDSITAGDRVSSGLEPFDTKLFYKDYPKFSAMGKMLSDHMSAVDVLAEMKGVDSARIGVIGHDMGGYNALMLAAFDERVQSCVASCAFTLMATDEDPGRWARKSGFVLMPKLRKSIETREFPFDWDGVLALIAPSPTLLITALNDDVLPNTKSCEEAAQRAAKVYKLFGAENAIENVTHRDGHTMSTEALMAADEWFERWL